MRNTVIADSGGTSTTWAFELNGQLDVLTTRSFHPRYVLGVSAEVEQEMEDALKELTQLELIFYGAGCGHPSTAQAMSELLMRLGFSKVTIHPDTLAACRSLLQHQKGWVAILGTGSVLVEYDGQQITRQSGGLGPILGDEGSGMHFGKLLLRSLLNGEIPWTSKLEQQIGTSETVKKILVGQEALPFLSGLAAKVDLNDFEALHCQNIVQFIDCQLVFDFIGEKVLYVIGGYAYAVRVSLEKALNEAGWKLGAVVKDPIEGLWQYHEREN